jgi:translocation and assembly module TamA
MRISGGAACLEIAAVLLLAGCRAIAPKPIASVSLRVSEVRLIGFDVLPPDARQQVRDQMPLKAGTPLTDAGEQSTGTMAVEALQNHGYPYAQVQIAREPAGAGLVRLSVTAVPGRLGFFGRTEIVGNIHTDDAIIRSRLAYLPGELFRRSALRESQDRLGALQLFKSVRIEVAGADLQPTDVPILITVTEQNPWRWNVALGYAASERLGVEARIGNMNFLGGARRLELTGRISKIDHLVEVGLIQPQLGSPRLTLSMSARDWSIDYPAFHAVSTGGQAAFTWVHNSRSSATVAYAVARERGQLSTGVLDSVTGLQNGLLSAWSVHLDCRTLTPSNRAPSGHEWTLYLEQAGGWMPGDFDYYDVIAEARNYHTSSNGRLTLAGFGRYGSISPMHLESEIPIMKRFFLGGPDQMRAWSRFEVGPLSPSGQPIGGKSLLAATAELRVQLLPKIRGALFLEAGNVWPTAWTVRLDDLKFDVGPGLRVESPFGLVRVDVGYQLNTIRGLRIDGDPQRRPWRLAISIGEAF